jgi:hypothetical protein
MTFLQDAWHFSCMYLCKFQLTRNVSNISKHIGCSIVVHISPLRPLLDKVFPLFIIVFLSVFLQIRSYCNTSKINKIFIYQNNFPKKLKLQKHWYSYRSTFSRRRPALPDPKLDPDLESDPDPKSETKLLKSRIRIRSRIQNTSFWIRNFGREQHETVFSALAALGAASAC